MYTISRGPSNIVNKTRRGLNQKLDNLESQRGEYRERDARNNSGSSNNNNTDLGKTLEMSLPKPVFYSVNGKKSSSCQRDSRVNPEITPHHEDIIKYISEDWCRVKREYDLTKHPSQENRGNVVYYPKTPDTQLPQNFKSFDLDTWWGKRIYQNITGTT